MFWYTEQRLYAGWGGAQSAPFTMQNGIRQGSVLSPHLFSVYVDNLNQYLNDSGIGCHIGGIPMNNFSYADDLAIVSPSASALNELLKLCEGFADDHHVIFNTVKSVCMCIMPNCHTFNTCPSIYLSGEKLIHVESFTYLGHVISIDFKDDADIRREIRSLSARGNTLIRKFKSCTSEVKCNLFKTFCYSLYCCGLWSDYKVSTMYRLKVTYNNIMRRLVNVPTYRSASNLFVTLGVRSLPEVIRYTCYTTRKRVSSSENSMIMTMCNSDARYNSSLWNRWNLNVNV